MSRRKDRYERRAQKREHNRESRGIAIGDPDTIFTFRDMFKYGKKCCNGVRWKQSTQNFELHLFSGTASRRKSIIDGTYKAKKYHHFTLYGRGKSRGVDAPHISDRQIQKVLTQKVLLPSYKPIMIHNNGASIKGKGLAFAQKELVKDLREHIKKYGFNGYIVLTDFKNFFPSANHAYIKIMHSNLRLDAKVVELLNTIFSYFKKGMPLGVEPSQIEMVAYPSKLDNYVVCQLGLQAGHYMDDYYFLVPPDRDPKEILKKFKDKAKENSITINENKTHILKFGQPFKFCKTKYIITPTGKIITHSNREALLRALRKIRKLKNKISLLDIWAITQACNNYYSKSDDHGKILKLRREFFRLYHFSCERYTNFLEA